MTDAMANPATLRIIRDEHAALAAVLRTMSMLVRDAHRHNRAPEFHALRAMLFYVDEFPERLHHVKESTMLFVRLRERTREADTYSIVSTTTITAAPPACANWSTC
jgi:hemerythrin-like domain-containing protein